MHAKARLNIEKAQESQCKYYNQKHKNVVFKVGDLVCLRTHYLSDKSRKIMKKICHKWTGPYEVTEVCSPLTYRIVEYESRKDAGVQNVQKLSTLQVS